MPGWLAAVVCKFQLPVSPAGVSRGAWPALKPPQPGVSQQLFGSAGLGGGFQQAQGRAGLLAAQQRVLPVPPGAGPAAKSSTTTTSTARPALGQDLDPLDRPKPREVRPPTDNTALQFMYRTTDTARFQFYSPCFPQDAMKSYAIIVTRLVVIQTNGHFKH